MKQKIVYLSLFISLFVNGVNAQDIYKDQVIVSNRKVVQKDTTLHIEMDVDCWKVELKNGEMLKLTPFLHANNQSIDLPAILINSSLRQKMYKRLQILGGQQKGDGYGNLTPSPIIVIENKKNKSQKFKYVADVPFHEWMNKSDLYILSDKINRYGKSVKIRSSNISMAEFSSEDSLYLLSENTGLNEKGTTSCCDTLIDSCIVTDSIECQSLILESSVNDSSVNLNNDSVNYIDNEDLKVNTASKRNSFSHKNLYLSKKLGSPVVYINENGKYSIQLGAFLIQANAMKLAEIIRKVYPDKTLLIKQDSLYIVRIGYCDSYTNILSYMDTIKYQ